MAEHFTRTGGANRIIGAGFWREGRKRGKTRMNDEQLEFPVVPGKKAKKAKPSDLDFEAKFRVITATLKEEKG